jgi:type IV pilus assembly protein PilA
VIIIGILAAIAIPTFLAQRTQAWEATARSDVRNAAAAATSCSADNDGSYANCNTAALLGPFGFNPSTDVTINSMTGNATTWTTSMVHAKAARRTPSLPPTVELRKSRKPTLQPQH